MSRGMSTFWRVALLIPLCSLYEALGTGLLWLTEKLDPLT
jgi:hypothetical protein